MQSTDYIDYRGQGGEARAESTGHRGCEPTECGAQTRLQRLEHRAGSTEQCVSRTGHGVQSTELGVQTADYIESTGGRPEGVSTGQEHSANVM